MEDKGPVLYVLFSSLAFSLLHSANAINPKTSSILVILQVVNAFLLGIIFALIYLLTKKILIVMLAHTFFNIFASISNQVSLERNVYSVIVLSILYVFCILVLAIIRKNIMVSVLLIKGYHLKLEIKLKALEQKNRK